MELVYSCTKAWSAITILNPNDPPKCAGSKLQSEAMGSGFLRVALDVKLLFFREVWISADPAVDGL